MRYKPILEEALKVTRSLSDEGGRSRVLNDIASELAKAGEFEEALKVARSLSDEKGYRSVALKDIASELAKAGEFEEALKVARSLSIEKGYCSVALKAIVPELAKAGEFEEALEVARSLSDERDYSEVLGSIAPKLAETSLKMTAMEKANKIIKEGNAAFDSGDLESGIEKYKRAIEIFEHCEEELKVKELKERINEKKERRKECSNLVSAVESEIARIKNIGIEIAEPEGLLLRFRQAFDTGDYEKAFEYAKQSEDITKRIKEEYRSEVIVDLPQEAFQPDTWKRVDITVRNIGSIPAKDVQIKPSGDLEFRDIPAITQLNRNETETITIAMKPTASGDVPIDIATTYKDGLNRDYRSSDEVWVITVSEQALSPEPRPARKSAAIEIKRGYEVLPNNDLRFGIRVINPADYVILDVETIIDYPRTLFLLKGDVVQMLANIPPNGERTAKYILTPKACIHNEKIDAIVRYKDHTGETHTVQMRSKEVHCVCPFLKEKPMREGEFAELAAKSKHVEEGLSFGGIGVSEIAEFIKESCTHRLHIVGEHEIDSTIVLDLAGESIGEKAYYLLTAVIQPYKEKDVTQIALRAYSDKPYGLRGFLNEIAGSVRHLVGSVQSAKEIGIIEENQVINIIDSVVQRTSFGGAGQGANTEVNIKDSIVHRSDLDGGDRDSREAI